MSFRPMFSRGASQAVSENFTGFAPPPPMNFGGGGPPGLPPLSGISRPLNSGLPTGPAGSGRRGPGGEPEQRRAQEGRRFRGGVRDLLERDRFFLGGGERRLGLVLDLERLRERDLRRLEGDRFLFPDLDRLEGERLFRAGDLERLDDERFRLPDLERRLAEEPRLRLAGRRRLADLLRDRLLLPFLPFFFFTGVSLPELALESSFLPFFAGCFLLAGREPLPLFRLDAERFLPESLERDPRRLEGDFLRAREPLALESRERERLPGDALLRSAGEPGAFFREAERLADEPRPGDARFSFPAVLSGLRAASAAAGFSPAAGCGGTSASSAGLEGGVSRGSGLGLAVGGLLSGAPAAAAEPPSGGAFCSGCSPLPLTPAWLLLPFGTLLTLSFGTSFFLLLGEPLSLLAAFFWAALSGEPLLSFAFEEASLPDFLPRGRGLEVLPLLEGDLLRAMHGGQGGWGAPAGGGGQP